MSPRFPGLALALVLAAACGSEKPRPGYAPRHLILVTVSGLRADHTSFHLYPRPTTWLDFDGGQRALGKALSLDDLAREGVNFARAYSPSGDTNAALASLFTGRSPLETGVLDGTQSLPSDVPTMAEAFSAAGFETVAFVSSPEAQLSSADGLSAGLERGFGRFFLGGSDVQALGEAVTWVTKRDWGTGQSTFAWVHLEGPTFPFEPGSFPGPDGPVDYATLFGDPAYAGPADGGAAFRESAADLSPEDAQRIEALYDGEVALANRALTYFLDYFLYVGQQSALWRESVFAFAGLHGVSLPSRGPHPDLRSGWGRTDTLGEGVHAVPLILRHPDSLTGSRVLGETVELVDLAPTLFDWFELAQPASASGRSLLAVTDSYRPRTFPPGPAVAIRADGSWSLRTEKHRLRLLADGQQELTLFDLERDPAEREDLAPSHPELVADLLEAFDRYLAAHPPHPSLLDRGFQVARPVK
ncbi:MAG: hypothetical protein CMJ87_02190 [Planctomycetes bacterium]|nr:hypothetical protein [Planctomycetota bacterium]